MLDGSSVSLTYFEERIWLFLSFCSNLRALKWKLFFLISAGFQGNNSLDVCIPSETVIIVVTLPISKADFFSDESRFISSVATAANVVPANVKILSVEETSTRAFRTVTARTLLGNSVQVRIEQVWDAKRLSSDFKFYSASAQFNSGHDNSGHDQYNCTQWL